MPAGDEVPGQPLATVEVEGARGDALVRAFVVTAVDGGATFRSRGADRCTIGSHASNDLVLDDPTVSRFHCEIALDGPGGARIRDLGSRNGTLVDGVRVLDGFLRDGSLVRLGRMTVRYELGADLHALPVSARDRFGGLIGSSVAMRTTFALLERAAASPTATVLLEGETGTGKGAMAEAIHVESARRDKAFVVVDCGALAPTLLDSELFGHERGAFTGADARRIGAFEEVDGGTLFLDEIGELPMELQPKLLRVLESREIRRLGQNTWQPVEFRLIAATNRDLRAEVNAGRFRADLYYRLAVVRVRTPALRERPEDVAAIARAILGSLRASDAEIDALLDAELVGRLQRAAWPGNVRELRNFLERALVLRHAGDDLPPAIAKPPDEDYAEARRMAIDAFERDYLTRMLAAHRGKVSSAAKAAGMARVYFYRLLKRHGIEV